MSFPAYVSQWQSQGLVKAPIVIPAGEPGVVLVGPCLTLPDFLEGILSLPLCQTPRPTPPQGSGSEEQRGYGEPAHPVCPHGLETLCRDLTGPFIFLLHSPNFYDTVNTSKAKQCLKTFKG